MTDQRPLLLIDGPFVLYRSFFAMPDTIRDPQDRPVGALLGSANLLLALAEETAPRAVVVCWGAEAARYRTELYPAYHAARPEPPEALADQFARAPALYERFGWVNMTDAEHEADDLLGSLATAEVTAGGRALIATGDRDMYQCASDEVTVLYLKMGARGYESVDPAEVERRYGVPPALVPDFIALRGDPSDGLPGAPGIGPKTAAELLRAHGTLEGVLAAARQPVPKLRPRIVQSLRDHAAALTAFKDIATLRDLSSVPPADRPIDRLEAATAARELGMLRLAGRLEAEPAGASRPA